MKIKIENGKASISTPYHSEFVRKIKRCANAKWDPEHNVWVVDAKYVPAVRQIMCDVYGESDIPESKRYDVKLTFHKSVYSICDGVFFFGKCVARAYGRDSGARVGEGVCYLAGECESGGSVRNWQSIVNKGSVVMLYDVPTTLVQDAEPVDGVDYEFIERTPDKNALVSEKNSLLARIAEIDALLETCA
ncbi:MAG: hypothetical protein HDT20_08025 [Oscillibacter sp.]|nr:hypothetical protein [Oscillibacter sp.]